MTTPYHIPALLPQTISALDIRPEGVYVDCTLGGAGHTGAILQRLEEQGSGHLVAFDRDADAIARAPQAPQLTAVHGNFRWMSHYLRWLGATPVDGILADLGVSFHHFDDATRGFSFRDDGPLDMRMNRADTLTAAAIVNDSTPERLTEILRLYGEVQGAPRMAAAIVRARTAGPILTTGQLAAAVDALLPPARRTKELAKVFQALRIVVNDELGALEALLRQSLQVMRPGARLAIITYHSLEDRLVKNFMRTGNIEGRVEQDIYGALQAPLRPVSNKPIVADAAEVERNPRSRSAKLRVAVKI